MTTRDAPREKKPITLDQCAVLATEFSRHLVGQPTEENIQRAFYEMLDHGEIVQLDHEEAHAVSEVLTAVGALPTGIESDCPIEAPFANHLLRAVRKVTFAHGRHYGLNDFDMGIEEAA